ncbi:MAG: hypothetical protein LBU50_01780 [Cellulomonas sp.]|nr:hypothetical protein [Cellulomonas sp.]
MLLIDLQTRVRIALTNTLVDEWSLFSPTAGSSSPSERTVAFHLGWNLLPLVERAWSIDCEYDRSGMALEDVVAFGGETNRIPDLIVHQRGKLGPEHNLLLLELSADYATKGATAGDFGHAQAIQKRFGYAYAVLVDLHLGADPDGQPRPTWHWSTLEGGPVTREPMDVYTPEVLASILSRGATRK